MAVGFVAVFYFFSAPKNNTKPTQIPEVAEQKEINPFNLNWEEISSAAEWNGRDSSAVIVFKGKIWVMGGVDGTKRLIAPGNIDYGNAPHFSDVWASKDGLVWDKVLDSAPWGERRSMQVAVFEDKLWLFGGWGPDIGYKNDVWSSEDGIKWKLERKSADWAAREGHEVTEFKGKLWLFGGVRYSSRQVFSDVWSSSDAINWDMEIKEAGWSPRWDFGSTVFNNKLWVVGGMDLKENVYKDVWSSEDGKNWNLINKNPAFLPRQGFSMFDYGGYMWAVGRLNIDEYGGGANDVWYSKDGLAWEKTKKNPLWTGREDAGAIIFNNRMCVLGGMDERWQWKNDIWCSVIENN